MSQLLKQSTAASVLVGPVLDNTGAAYTGMAIGDFNITKNGTTAAMASAATATHSHNGHYIIALTTGNTDTLGRLAISCNKSTYTMGRYTATVLTSSTFDAIVTNAATAAGGLCDVQRVTGYVPQVDASGYFKVSSGTGTGQISFLGSGVVQVDVQSIAGSGSTAQTLFGFLTDSVVYDGNEGTTSITLQDFTVLNAFATGTFTIGGTNLSDLISSGSLTAATVWGYTNRTLTSGTVITVEPVQTGVITVVVGDSYINSTSTAISVAKANGAPWPSDLTGMTITFTAKPTDDAVTEYPALSGTSITATGTVVTATGSSQKVRLDLTATQTAALQYGTALYEYDVQASSGSARYTLEQGVLHTRKQITTS